MSNTQQYETFEEQLAGALESKASDEIRVTRTGEGDANITSWGGANQSSVDVAKKIDEMEDALESVGTDEWRHRLYGLDNAGNLQESGVEALDTAASTTDYGVHTYLSRALSSLAADEVRVDTSPSEPMDVSGAPVPVEDTGGNQIDPATEGSLTSRLGRAIEATNGTSYAEIQRNGNDLRVSVEQEAADLASETTLSALADALASNATDEVRVDTSPSEPMDVSGATVGVENTDDNGNQTTSTGTDVSVSNPDGAVGIVADTSGSATLSVEVSTDGGTNWAEYTVSIADGSGHYEEVHGFTDVRASVNQNLTRLTIMAKGVGG